MNIKLKQKLIVGVDGRWLSRPLSGIGRYTQEICIFLATMPKIKLIIYSNNIIDNQYLTSLPVTIRTKKWQNSLLRQIWFETYVPIWAKQDKLDVFWGPGHKLPLLLSKKITQVVTIHDLAWKFVGNTMRYLTCLQEKYQLPFTLRKANHVIVSSQATANDLTKIFHEVEHKLSIIFPGLTEKLLHKNKKFINENNFAQKPYFLFVGTLEPRKNLHNLLKAYATLSIAIKQKANFIIVGAKGWGQIDVDKLIVDLQLQKYVINLGRVKDEDLHVLYSRALFLAMPSLYEGFGLPLIEAMSYGIPVLTANNSSMPEVAGKAGLFVNARNYLHIAEGLQKLIQNDKLRQQLAQYAYQNSCRFNWQKTAHNLHNIFWQN